MKGHVNSNRLWIALSTTFFIGLVFAYYFFIYVPDNEEYIISKKHRSMKRIGQNLVAMKDDYEHAISQEIAELRKDCNDTSLIRKKKIEAAALGVKINNEINSIQNSRLQDELQRKQRELSELTKTKRECDEIPKQLKSIVDRLKAEFNFCPSEDTFAEKISNPEKVLFFSRKHLTASVDVSHFLASQTLIDNHFDRFLVIRLFNRKDTIKANIASKENKDSTLCFIAFQGNNYSRIKGSESKVLLGNLTTLFHESQGLNSIPVRTVNISGIAYRMFPHVIQMELDDDWILAGLVMDDDIVSESRSVPLIVVIFLTLVFIFLLVSMPVLKLLVMSPIEKLHNSNVWFLGFSVVIGSSVAILLLLVGHHYVDYKTEYEQRLEALSVEVHKRFNAEISNSIRQIRSPATIDLIRHPLDKGSFLVNGGRLATRYGKEEPYPFYNETILLNREGDALITLATHPLQRRAKIPNLKERQYFQSARDKKLYPLAIAENPARFAVQSIFSWNSRAHEAGISIRPDSAYVIRNCDGANVDTLEVFAIATKLKSVMDPLLQPGFAFCIIDETGEVLFHSQKDKNTQENFFDETGGNKKLQAAIEGRLSVPLNLEYAGQSAVAYVRPVQNQPMSLITLYDTDYYATPIVLTLCLTIVMIGSLFFLQGIQLLLLFVTTYRSTKLKVKRFFLYWLRPRVTELVPDSTRDNRSSVQSNEFDRWKRRIAAMPYYERYRRGIAVMFVTSILVVIVAFLNTQATTRALIVSLITLPILYLMFFFVILYDRRKEEKVVKRQYFLSASGCFLGLTDLMMVSFLGWSVVYVLLLQAFVLMIMLIGISTPLLTVNHQRAENRPTTTMYVTFMFCWLLVVSVLPTCIFYKAAYKRESMIWQRFLQWETVKRIEQRKAYLHAELRNMIGTTKNVNVAEYERIEKAYYDECNHYGSYISIKPDRPSNDSSEFVPVYYTALEAAEFDLRPSSSGLLEGSRKVVLANMHDRSWKWFVGVNSLILKDEDDEVHLSASLSEFSLLKGSSIFFLLTFVVMAGFMYKLIHSSIKYIFGIGFLPLSKDLTRDHADQILNGVTPPRLKYRLFLVGLPYSGKHSCIRRMKRKLRQLKVGRERHNFPYIKKELDFRKDVEASPAKPTINTLYVLTHFEYGINDHAVNEKKFRLIEAINRQRNIKLIITTAVEPTLILDVYERKLEKLLDETKKEEQDSTSVRKELSDLRCSYRKWKTVLAGFEVKYIPLQYQEGDNLRDSELSIGTYLPKLKEQFKEGSSSDEDFVLEVEEAATPYYHALWNSFSRTEKRILFDLAQDKFINVRDIAPVRRLIKKGVIIMEDAPRIFNRSFNNFILEAVKEDEELAMKNESIQNGAWHSLKLILIITLISIIVFIALVQKELLTNVNATIATVSGVVALLVRFSGFFVGNRVKESH